MTRHWTALEYCQNQGIKRRSMGRREERVGGQDSHISKAGDDDTVRPGRNLWPSPPFPPIPAPLSPPPRVLRNRCESICHIRACEAASRVWHNTLSNYQAAICAPLQSPIIPHIVVDQSWKIFVHVHWADPRRGVYVTRL